MNIAEHQTPHQPRVGNSASTVPNGALHDNIALALDAICAPRLSERNLSEARTYLRDALRQIGGAV